MSTLSKAESRRLYSWWWDSHISPKNSKWLQENLTDMDSKVKSMIKLIEEDADSFARRAEMYYKKRPELLKLVEEFYRAYRALAERYDHATGALRQAHRTMSEAFPNQLPFALTDESPCITTSAETEPCTPDNLPPTSPFFDSDDLHKDFSSPSSPFHVKRNGAYPDDNDSGKTKKGLKQLTEFFSNNHVRKGLNFQEEENKGSETEKRNGMKSFQKIRGDEASQKVKSLHEDASKLSDENESLKIQMKSEPRDRTKAESELQWLEKAYSKLKSERDDAVENFQESLRRISVLEAEIENFKTQSSEILAKISELQNVEEKSVQLEKENFSLKLDIGTLEQNSNEQQKELSFKEQELEKLMIAIKDEHMRCVHAEASLESLQALHAQSVETMKISALEFQNGVQLLKETETKKQLLEKELENVKMEIQNLNDVNVSSQQLIKTLQDENLLLKDTQNKLENEVEHVLNVKKSLEQELYHLNKETDDLLQSHKSITDQIEAVGLNEESLQSSVKELQDINLELKELCKKKEIENVLLLKKLKEMQEIFEQNARLDNSLSEANIELDGLRSKIKAVEESCELLNGENLALESEKTVLFSKLDTVMDSLANLSKENILLESSLSDSVVELEELRRRLKSLEESCQSLEEEKANLQFEKGSLISQVDSMTTNIEDMEKRFTKLHDLNSDLEKEKKIKDSELTEFQTLFNLKRQKYEALIDASNSRLASMESEIRRLQQNSNCREEELVEEQHKFFSAQIEIFIFQRSICDLKERNFILSKEWQKMEQYILRKQEKEIALSNRIKRLKKVIHIVWQAINTNEDGMLMDGSEELSLQFILDKIKGMQNAARDAEDERQSLLLEKSVYVTLLQQLGHHITDLRLEKNELYQECRKKTDELLVVENEKNDLLEIKRQMKYESDAGQQRVGRLEEEMKLLDRQTLDLKEAHDMSKSENQKLLEENNLLSSTFSNLKEEMHLLEEEYGAIFQRAAVLDSLSLVFEQLSSDKMSDLKTFNDDLIHSRKTSNDLENKVMELAVKSEVIEAENMFLKDLALKLKRCRDHLAVLAVDMSMARTANEELSSQIEQLDQLIENRNSLLIQKNMELSEADLNVQNLQSQNEKLHGNLEGIKLELGEIKAVRDGLEKKMATFLENMANKEKEIALALEKNKILGKELQRLDKENGDLTRKERESTTMMLDEVDCCEKEFAGLCNDIRAANVHAASFEEKVLDLMRICEYLEARNMVEREASNEEVLSKNVQIKELITRLEELEEEEKIMKSDLNEYVSIVASLGNGISSLENLIITRSKRHTSDHLKMQDDNAKDVSHFDGRESTEQNDDPKREVPLGVLELQKLLGKIKILQEAIMEYGSHLSSSEPNHHLRIEAPEEEKNEGHSSSKTVAEEELIDDNLGVAKKTKDFHRSWSKKIVEGLSSDSKRLAALQEGFEELKIKMERSEEQNIPKSFEFGTIKTQLQDAEASIILLLETNKELIDRAQGCSTSSDSNDQEIDEGKDKKRQVLEYAQRGSDKIERLELELQKLQYILLKLEEEYENRHNQTIGRRSRVLLRDYLYGRRDRRRRSLCGCFGPTVSDD